MRKLNQNIRFFIYLIFITLFTQIDELGFINIGLVAITTLPIIVVPIILAENDWKSTIVVSIMWGVNAWVRALLNDGSEIANLFDSPLVSLLPRMLTGIISFMIIRKIFKLTKKFNTDNTEIWSYIISTSMVISFAIIGSIISNEENSNYQVIWTTIFAMIGSLLAWMMFKQLESNKLSGQNFIAGLLSGATIAFVHTILVLTALKFLSGGDQVMIDSVINYSIRTSAIVELGATAFITMSIYPSISNIKWRDKK